MFRGGDKGGPVWQRGGQLTESHSSMLWVCWSPELLRFPSVCQVWGLPLALIDVLSLPVFPCSLLGRAVVQVFPSSSRFLRLGRGLG